MYNNRVEKVFFDWKKLKGDATSYKDVDRVLRRLLSVPLPEKLNSKLKPYKYFGYSFLLEPLHFLDCKTSSEFKLQALELASTRNYADYILYGNLGVNIEISPFTKRVLSVNPLLELKNDTIYIKTGTKWH